MGAGGLAWLRYRLDMAGVVGSNPTRPTTLCYDFRNNSLLEQLFMASLQRYPNQAIPSVSSPAPAASESCSAASINCNLETVMEGAVMMAL